jgi:two-component system chemotaxis response regulator CheY
MGCNILLVDDSRTVKAVITKALQMSGLALGTLFNAGNGREGLEVLRKEKVDLVFADINMPVMGGVEMVEEMKRDAALRAIPIVVISTEGSAVRIQDLKDKGVDAFLRKPFAPEALKKTVESVLGGSHA